MFKTAAQTALVLALLAGGASLAIAQAGPVDGKGQAGGVSHTGSGDPSGAKTEMQQDKDKAMTADAYGEKNQGSKKSKDGMAPAETAPMERR